MKIAVICSNGRVGSQIVKKAQAKGIEVTGFARGENKSGAKTYVEKDLFSITSKDLEGYDVVVDAFGAWNEKTIPGIPAAVEHLLKVLKGSKSRLMVVGGAGSLYVNKEHTITVDMGPDFPDAFKPLSYNHSLALKALRESKGVSWTYISPAGDFQAEGEETGEYQLGGEELLLNSKGESAISYADYAIGFVDEIISGTHLNQRISLVSK